jgi:putative heme-binding domain-containing protein
MANTGFTQGSATAVAENVSHLTISDRRKSPMLKHSLLLLAVLWSSSSHGQTPDASSSVDPSNPQVVAAGEKTFAASCSVGYCHGKAGRAGRGPRLRGKTWDKQYLYNVMLNGVPSSSMPAWKDRLSEREIWEVVAYVMTLSKVTSDAADSSDLAVTTNPSESPEPKEQPSQTQPSATQPTASLTGDPERGKSLFFDPSNDLNCGNCHQVRGVGNRIGPDLTRVQQRSVKDLFKAIVLPSATIAPGGELLKITTRAGEQIEGLIVEESGVQIKLYDVGSLPPVLRTLPKTQIERREAEKRSGMPEKYGEIYTIRQLLDIIAYLKSGDASTMSAVSLQDLF